MSVNGVSAYGRLVARSRPVYCYCERRPERSEAESKDAGEAISDRFLNAAASAGNRIITDTARETFPIRVEILHVTRDQYGIIDLRGRPNDRVGQTDARNQTSEVLYASMVCAIRTDSPKPRLCSLAAPRRLP